MFLIHRCFPYYYGSTGIALVIDTSSFCAPHPILSHLLKNIASAIFPFLSWIFNFLPLLNFSLSAVKIWCYFSQLNHTHAHSLQLLTHFFLLPFTVRLLERIVHLHWLGFLSCLLNAFYIRLPLNTILKLLKFSNASTLLNPMLHSQCLSWAISGIWHNCSLQLLETQFFICLSGQHFFLFCFSYPLATLSLLSPALLPF